MKRRLVTAMVNYSISGKLTMQLPSDLTLKEMHDIFKSALENQGVTEETINFKCVDREMSVGTMQISKEES